MSKIVLHGVHAPCFLFLIQTPLDRVRGVVGWYDKGD